MPVMLENYQGEREIQPGSLWPGLVLGGAALRAWQTARSRNQMGLHLTTPQNMWLPSAESSEQDLEALKRVADRQDDCARLQDGLGHIALNDLACWVPTENGVDMLSELAQLETSARPLEDVSIESRPAINMCGTANCQYPRHFDITYSVPSNRRALLYPNTELFQDEGDRGVRTAWGDFLPPVAYSRQNLQDFQHACSPYVAPSETLLTVGGIAQISLLPPTGCWFVRSYFMTPVGVEGYDNWQYDGYGRLCGFRPCANPDNIEQVTTRANNEHGIAMKRAIESSATVTYPVESIDK